MLSHSKRNFARLMATHFQPLLKPRLASDGSISVTVHTVYLIISSNIQGETMAITAQRWDLSNVYPSLESNEFKAAVTDYKKQVAELQDYFDEVVTKATTKTDPQELASIIGDVV